MGNRFEEIPDVIMSGAKLRNRSIPGDKVKAGAVTITELDPPTAARIKKADTALQPASELDGEKIKLGTITGDKVKPGWLTTKEMDAAINTALTKASTALQPASELDGAKVKAKSLHASSIVAGTVTKDEMQDGAVLLKALSQEVHAKLKQIALPPNVIASGSGSYTSDANGNFVITNAKITASSWPQVFFTHQGVVSGGVPEAFAAVSSAEAGKLNCMFVGFDGKKKPNVKVNIGWYYAGL